MKYKKHYGLVFLLLTTLLLSKQVNAALPSSINTLQYQLTYNAQQALLTVSLTFKGEHQGWSIIQFPSETAGISDLYKNISNIQASNATIKKTTLPYLYLLKYKPDSNVTLNYQVQQGWDGPPINHNQFRAPILQNTYFQFTGESVLAYPQSYAHTQNIKLIFDWIVPHKWIIANSYGAHDTHQQVTTNLIDLSESLFLSGDYRLYPTQVTGGIIWTAVRGQWPFSDKEFNNTAIKIISVERNFWRDYRFPNFLLSVIPVGTGCDSRGGTGLNHAFAIFMGSDCSLNSTLFLIAHENFHAWNSPAIFTSVNSKNQRYYAWFAEGFTNYYANLLALRAGLINFNDYIERYNKILATYYSSPAKLTSIKQVQKKFWSNKDIQQLPYQQGEILAHNWNAEIKQASNDSQSLDDLMKILINPTEPENSNLTITKLNRITRFFIKRSVIKDIDAIYQGKLIKPNPNSLGPCAYLTKTAQAIPQFAINQTLWKNQPDQCLAWFDQ